ncbi:hypothetical protein F2Q70_00022988 [Brassica cretica]|uniref:Uncharacterized protein n=1 Tax=Brassica cretica TaxID=69181 RepID=A0A8S9GX30_BRACR|nr:hypothetical protein F2Q70_00022988 [Brassica cretica]
MSFGGSHWCRSTPDSDHRSTDANPNRSTRSSEHRSVTPMEVTRSPASIDRRAPITYRVHMPKIDVARLNALKLKPKPSENPPETVRIPSDDGEDSMEVDRVPMGRTLRKR